MMRLFFSTAGLDPARAARSYAQTPVVGVATFRHEVANLDKTMQFYSDRLQKRP
jgi:hypothetical protein